MIVHELKGARAPSRSDGQVFTQVVPQESTLSTGPWTGLAVQNLAPPDVDGNNPLTRNITFLGNLEVGYYRLIFIDALGNNSPPTNPVLDSGGSGTIAWAPTLEQVGALVRTRTVDRQGNELGTFTPDTIPTDIVAQQIIDSAVEEAYPVFGQDILDAPGTDPDALRRSAARITALRAAALIELTKAPEQVARGNSPYQQYQDSFEKGLKTLGTAISQAGAGDTPGTSDDIIAPVSSFPDDDGGMVGWVTVW